MSFEEAYSKKEALSKDIQESVDKLLSGPIDDEIDRLFKTMHPELTDSPRLQVYKNVFKAGYLLLISETFMHQMEGRNSAQKA